jgi:uridine kinase
VVLLVGPSGCGKSYLAQSVGLPILALDDFYRPDTDPLAPRGDDGLVDWEDPRSWDAEAAADALERFCCDEAVVVPDYSFADNRAIGTKVVDRAGSCVVVAEGIFAAELIDPLRERCLLADALLISQNRWITFARRLWRDLREGRKAPWYLVRQGWAKAWDEPHVVARQLARGARPVTKADARTRLQALAARPSVASEATDASAAPHRRSA